MAQWESRTWVPTVFSGVRKQDRVGGPFSAYVPDLLAGAPISVDPELAERIAQVEREVISLASDPAAGPLEHISRLLLRSEAIASSRIEDIAPGARAVVQAERHPADPSNPTPCPAQLVAANIAALSQASHELARRERVDVEAIVALHRALLAASPYQGVRTQQNWIGGSPYGPIGAQFVPPDPARVPELLQDLCCYMNGAAHSALVQAALVHAQFETIHPFADGNGRVGRALVHTVLTRRGLTRAALLPISPVLATLQRSYVDGLTAFRYDGPRGSDAEVAGVNAWIEVFVGACALAVGQARQVASDLRQLRADQDGALVDYRVSQKMARPIPRADSTTARLLDLLPKFPLLTAETAALELGVSGKSARAALEELTEAKIVVQRSLERGTKGYYCDDILALLDMTERRLGSEQFDTTITGWST